MATWHQMIGYVSSFLSVLGWLLAVGGTRHAADVCKGAIVEEVNEDCEDFFRPFWWSIFFQFFVLIGILIVLCLSYLENARLAVISFLILSTVDIMDQAESALNKRDLNFPRSAINSSAAGFVIMSLANFLSIIVIGTKQPVKYTPPEVYEDLENAPYKPKNEINHVADYTRKDVIPREALEQQNQQPGHFNKLSDDNNTGNLTPLSNL